jgi:hypothetical protein
MKEIIFDIEADDLLPKVSKMHVISWQQTMDNAPKSSAEPSAIDTVFDTDILIGHFIIGYDLKAIEKLFGKKLPDNVIVADTLILSWYLDPERLKYGLESYGESFKIPKVKIDNWADLTYGQYEERCERDVEINTRQWKRIKAKLAALYGKGEDGGLSDGSIRLIKYLSFKLSTAVDTEQHGIRLDYNLAKEMSDKLTIERDKKFEELTKSMPKHALIKRVSKPKNMTKKDGSLSKAGKRWLEHIREAKMPSSQENPFNVIFDYEDGNPGSNPQIKHWLYSLGWEPITFKFTRNKNTGEDKLIPQIRKKGELCKSVAKLAAKDPAINQLEGLTVLTHRIGLFNGYLNAAEKRDGDWWISSKIEGLTNTFRFKHRAPLANLPGVDKLYGEEVRACLLAPSDEHVVIGADMVSLEDTTKRHYMQPLDPDYVAEMSVEGFDPHLNLAQFAGVVTQDECDKYSDKVGEVVEKLYPIRKKFKAVNYSATYGIGKDSLARDTGMAVAEAAKLLKAFWRRNWALTELTKQAEVKVIADGSMWVFNPVSGFWMSLRYKKDTFSTLNQSTGVFVFDTWLYIVLQKGLPIIMQYHDEYLSYVKKGEEGKCDRINEEAIVELNEKLKLNVQLGSDWAYGNNYASVH